MQVVIISLIIGSLFSHQQHTQDHARAFFAVSFLSVMFLAFGSMPELAITLSMKGWGTRCCQLWNTQSSRMIERDKLAASSI